MPEAALKSYPKFEYVRSKRLLQAVASLPCQHCGRHGLTQAAHSNEAVHGKGRGIKASDLFTAALCCYCHAAVDCSNKLSREERQTIWADAWIKTVRTLVSEGMWPKDVPIPDIRRMN